MKKILFLFAALAFIALGAAVTWSVVNYANVAPDENDKQREAGFLKTSGEFKEKLADIKMKRDRAELQIDRLEDRKKQAADKLRNKGVRNVGDVNDQEGKLLLHELKDIVAKQDQLKDNIKTYDDAIVSIEAILRDFDRDLVMTGSGISDKQFEELRRIVLDVDDKLTGDQSVLDDLESQDLLDDILGDDSSLNDSSSSDKK